MAAQPFISPCYAGQDRQVSWAGVQMDAGDEFAQLLTTEVTARVHDEEGASEFEAHLRRLATTGIQQESLQSLLHLSREHGIEWPWNSERDKRTPLASLPGAYLVGLMGDDGIFGLTYHDA